MEIEREVNKIAVVCRECNQAFLLSVGEQNFYRDRQLPLLKRCPQCHLYRKGMRKRIRESEQ
jgi:ssDNA-binding Zn-finger/Zn-ribbon topoisomerase 1